MTLQANTNFDELVIHIYLNTHVKKYFLEFRSDLSVYMLLLPKVVHKHMHHSSSSD